MSLTLPDYRVVSTLGQGANSTIYCVQNIESGELRAAKHVKINDENERKFIDQLRSEQAAGQAMDHPTIRKVYDLRYIRKPIKLRAAVLLMEYVEGTPMSSSSFRPTIEALLRHFRRIAEGLHTMHHCGLVHADLKPGNLLVTPQDEVKLIDFGQSSAMLEAKERIQGTIDYMAPEQARRSVLDQRTDVFGLGATLYRVLTGRAIVTEMNKTVGLHAPTRIGKRLNDLKRPISVDLPTCVIRLIDDCCRDEPVDRLGDMRAVMNRIDLTQTILEHRAARAAQESDDPETAERRPSSRRPSDETEDDSPK